MRIPLWQVNLGYSNRGSLACTLLVYSSISYWLQTSCRVEREWGFAIIHTGRNEEGSPVR